VTWLLLYGVFTLAASRCLGICLDGLSTCLRVDGPLEGQGVLRCEKWCPIAFFGLFGRRGIIGTLRVWRDPWRIFYHLYSILCIFGLQPLCPLRRLVMMIFLFDFLFLDRCLLLYTPSVLSDALCF
jgi:hypothetical protein